MFKINCCNQKCGKLIITGDSRKKYCDKRCNNQANFFYKKKVLKWEIDLIKTRNKNTKILEYLVEKKYFTVSKRELKILGFDFEVSNIPMYKDNGLKLFRFGNYGIIIISNRECKIITFETNE
jgi:hypothetical protein